MPTTIATDFGAIKTASHTDVTAKSSALSITPTDVGQNLEDICTKIIADMNLQNILDQGNSATSTGGHTNTIQLNNGVGDFKVIVDPSGTFLQKVSSADFLIGIYPEFSGLPGIPCLVIGDPLTGHLLAYFQQAFTADRTIQAIDASGSNPVTVQHNRVTAQTAAYAGVAFTAPAADTSFEVSANLLVTISTTHNFAVNCTYTDESNTVRTLTLWFADATGIWGKAILDADGVTTYNGASLHIRAKGGTTITLSTAGTFTTVTYNFESIIKQLT